MSIFLKKKKRGKTVAQNMSMAKPTFAQRATDVFLQVMWGLGLIVTFSLMITKILSPDKLQSTRFEYLLVSLVVFLLIPYLGKFEAFGVKVETRRRVDEVELKVETIDSRLKALPDYMLGSEYYSEKDYQLAKESLRKSLTADPTFWPAEFCLGTIAQEEERYDEAFRAYKKVLEIEPDNIYAYNNLADAYLYSPPPFKNPERALQCAEKVLTKLDGMGSALQYKCEALNRLGRYTEAEHILKEIVDNDVIPNQRHWALYELALAKSKRGTRIETAGLSRMYEIALNNGEGEYFLEMAEEEVELFEDADRKTILNFVKEHKEAEESII
jgi:tetratricopeptide (TPR) repeat protein